MITSRVFFHHKSRLASQSPGSATTASEHPREGDRSAAPEEDRRQDEADGGRDGHHGAHEPAPVRMSFEEHGLVLLEQPPSDRHRVTVTGRVAKSGAELPWVPAQLETRLAGAWQHVASGQPRGRSSVVRAGDS